MNEIIEMGLRAAQEQIHDQDKIWSRYSNDKVDIAGGLARVIRTLSKSLPLRKALTALSIGSSNEPQFRILESAFRGGLYLLDIEEAALDIVAERIQRQNTKHVKTIQGNYRDLLLDEINVRHFRKQELDGHRMTLITLHHSLYYSPKQIWPALFRNMHNLLLAKPDGPGPSAAIHAVLMANHSNDRTSTTWLYNHFAGQFFGAKNDQDLKGFARELRRDPAFAGSQVLTRTSRVEFHVDDFERFMSVVWMILLHPYVHVYSRDQQSEITEYVYTKLWERGVPLVQMQDHLAVYRGKGLAGFI
ncbi:class I SAM-dependent methyltransferase [bacterium]|nr:class I SAM-dependent methyltransferase [bacterium]